MTSLTDRYARKPPSHRPSRSLSAQRHTGHVAQVQTFCRFRPLLSQENSETAIAYLSDCAVRVGTESITLDRVFTPSADQQEVFTVLGKSAVADVQAGFNGSIFAYGQTGSGKTYTMLGSDGENEGLIPRCAIHLLQCRANSQLACSMVEIYREKILDLLQPGLKPLKVKENPISGVFMQGVTEVTLRTEWEVRKLLRLGLQQRTVAATTLNQLSSRSHAIVTLKLLSDRGSSVLHLVDLAGSERLTALQVSPTIVQDAKKINLSLSVLGTVISALATGAEHVPYRDSKLTRVLQDALGGNCKTNVLVNCSPASEYLEETLRSLRFAQRTKLVRNKICLPPKSANTSSDRIQCLEAELHSTREELQRYRENTSLTPRRHESPGSFDCSSTYRVFTAETFEDSYCDSGRKPRLHSPDSFSPGKDLTRQKRQEFELKALRKERDKYRNRAEELSEKLSQVCVKLKSQKNRQDSDAEKRKILMLKISADSELIRHMKTRVELLTKQVKHLSTALQTSKENDSGSWALFSLGVRCEIKESLCAIQSQQIVELETVVDELRQTSSGLRQELLRSYKQLAEVDSVRACHSVLGEAPRYEEESVRFSTSTESADLLARRLNLATQAVAEKDRQLQHTANSLQSAHRTIKNLQSALNRLQTRDLPWTGACGDTQPPEEL